MFRTQSRNSSWSSYIVTSSNFAEPKFELVTIYEDLSGNTDLNGVETISFGEKDEPSSEGGETVETGETGAVWCDGTDSYSFYVKKGVSAKTMKKLVAAPVAENS